MFAKRFFRNKKKLRIECDELITPAGMMEGMNNCRFPSTPKGTREVSITPATGKSNLLEIKLKDTDSVPEVYYNGERLDKSPKGLVDISYHWKTDGYTDDDRGANDIAIEYYSTPDDKYLDKKTISHERVY